MKVKEFRLKLYPRDFNGSRAFYKEVLGLEIINEWNRGPDDMGVMFRAGLATLELLTPEDGHQSYAGTGLSLEVEDVKQLAADLKGKCEITHELRHNDWGDTSLGITDPEGYKISLFTKD